MMDLQQIDFPYLRQQIVGIDSTFDTPFGKRLMVYCDYTASGRSLHFIEQYIQSLQRNYANTHTEDDISGRSMTRLLHQAEDIIKRSVNAGPGGRIIAVGTGATGAIDKLQQLIGIALPPATRQRLLQEIDTFSGRERHEEFIQHLAVRQPVVFVGPYEHHSNEVTWRQGVATVVEVNLTEEGEIDLDHLELLLQAPEYSGRFRIGSFSAASNVTGMRTPVQQIARMLHQYDALACFDYAASAPYVEIDMNPSPGPEGGDPSLDAIFISPHKFLGGPGSAGILVFNERIYRQDLPPTVGGGGTVEYVGPRDQDFITDIEEREKAGTPGILQIMKAALVFQIKEAVSIERIEIRESELTRRALSSWGKNPNIEILGNPDPERRISVISFNVRDPRGLYLHPKFVTALLNDLFGIQSRAGCSCAGPYGHHLLGIDHDTAEQYRTLIQKGYQGIKPGWCRIGIHYTVDDSEADYIINAVNFVGDKGYRFLSLYDFNAFSGTWAYRGYEEQHEPFGLEVALNIPGAERHGLPEEERTRLYTTCLQEAESVAEGLGNQEDGPDRSFEIEFGDLQFFST